MKKKYPIELMLLAAWLIIDTIGTMIGILLKDNSVDRVLWYQYDLFWYLIALGVVSLVVSLFGLYFLLKCKKLAQYMIYTYCAVAIFAMVVGYILMMQDFSFTKEIFMQSQGDNPRFVSRADIILTVPYMTFMLFVVTGFYGFIGWATYKLRKYFTN